MKTIILNKLSIITIILLMLGMFSCTKEDINLNDLDETIFVRHKNADMPAYIHGNGAEKVFLVILHGGPGGNGLAYRQNTFITEIEKNNAVVYFDQRNSGNAQGSYSEADLTVDIMAEDVLALAKVLKAKFGADAKLFLMGHSWGGALGPATLLKDQNDFTGWIDVAGAHDPKGMYDNYKIILKDIADEQIALENNVQHWQNTLETVEDVSQNFNVDDFFRLNRAAHAGEAKLEEDEVINKSQSDVGDDFVLSNPITNAYNGFGIINILSNKRGLWENVSFTDQLSEITIPSLVLWGKYDLIVPTLYAQEAFDNLGSSDKDLFIFEKSAHSPMSNEPELFADKVIEFINGH